MGSIDEFEKGEVLDFDFLFELGSTVSPPLAPTFILPHRGRGGWGQVEG
jgi:hypothetical protein